jgi:hypothetical protein
VKFFSNVLSTRRRKVFAVAVVIVLIAVGAALG